MSKIENLNQRLQEDTLSYPDLVLSLLFGTGKAILYIIVFVSSMIISFSWIYLIILIIYSIVGSYMAKRVAYPLIKLNYEQQKVEATYRNNICITNFADCVRVMLGLANKQKHLSYFQNFYGQVGAVLPLIVIAPAYFTTGMTIGNLMRFNSVSSTILDNMSFGINNFSSINKLLSCRRRLKEAGVI